MYDELKIGYCCFSDSAKIGDEKKTNPTTRIAIPRIKDLITAKNSDETNFWFQNSNLAAKANKYKKVNITLSSGTWSGSVVPYKYTATVSGVTATNEISIVLNSTDTTVANAWMDASVVSGTQTTNSITLYAFGKKPSTNIPITVLVGNEVTT